MKATGEIRDILVKDLREAWMMHRAPGSVDEMVAVWREQMSWEPDSDLAGDEDERCEDCGVERLERECVMCHRSGAYIDCGHQRQPRPISAGWGTGEDLGNDYCEDCSFALEIAGWVWETA